MAIYAGWRNRIGNASAGRAMPIDPKGHRHAILLLTLCRGRAPTVAPRPHRPDPKVLVTTGSVKIATFGPGALEPGLRMSTAPFSVEALAARARAPIAGLD